MVKNIRPRLNRILCQQINGGYYKNLYNNFACVLNTLNILDLSHDEHEVWYIHFKKISCFNTKSSSIVNFMKMKNELLLLKFLFLFQKQFISQNVEE